MKKLLTISTICLISALFAGQALAAKQPHKEYSSMKVAECNDCHKGEGVASNHGADWLREHRLVAAKGGTNCGQCHRQDFCLDCHKGGGINADLSVSTFGRDYVPKSHRSDFVTQHPLKAQNNQQSCYRCHEQKYCNSCHARFPKGSLRIKSHLMLGPNNQRYAPALGEHAIEARRNLQSCQTCHPEGDVCIQCHASGKTNPHPRNWKGISSNYKDKSGTRVCLKCHIPGSI